MNEVKKSLDAVSGIHAEDMEDVKRKVLSGKHTRKKRNPFPAAVTALVAAAVLFFAFNVLQDGLSTADQDEYEINELIYDFMLRNEADGNRSVATDEMKQAVLQSMLQIDSLIEYAKTVGYEEDVEAIDKAVAEHRDAFYADLDKEGDERKNIILQAQKDTFGITYDEYFDVLLKWTAGAETATNWIIHHPPEVPITSGEALRLFQNKYERTIANFMEQKAIPPFDLSVKYEELEGTVAAIEGKQIIVTYGFIEDAPSKKEKLLINGEANRFLISDAPEEIVPGMDIRLVYDALSYPVASEGFSMVYKKVTQWEQVGTVTEPEYLAQDQVELSKADIQPAYEMCVAVLNDYYKAIWNGTDINLDRFIENENLKQYTEKKVQSQQDIYGGLNSPVKELEIPDWEAEYKDDADGGFIYLNVAVAINKYQGGYGEGTEFLVRNVDGKLVIVDWYTGAKDSYDFMTRGENETIDNPDIWNDVEWVKGLGVFRGALK